MVSIGMNPQHALDLAVQPSPVLMQAVVKVPLPTLIDSLLHVKCFHVDCSHSV